MKYKIAASTAACTVCLSLVAPTAFAATGDHDVLTSILREDTENAQLVVTPGTDDTGRDGRIKGLIGDRDTRYIEYPESFFPIIAGKSGKLLPIFAPTYDTSRNIAIDENLKVMEALKDADKIVVYTGYSQGADALGDAAEQAVTGGLLGDNDRVLLVSDPRSPWGLKSAVHDIPFMTPIMAMVGIENNGARDPGKTGDVKVVHVIVQGDPVAHAQWNPYRPVSSLLVNGAGFLAIHSWNSKYGYANIDNLTKQTVLYSKDGNSEYQIYDTYHPLALLNAMIYESMGMEVSEETLKKWDKAAEAFYPTQEITVDNADKNVKVTETNPRHAASETTGAHTLLDANGEQVVNDQSGTPRHAAPPADTGSTDQSQSIDTVARDDGQTTSGSTTDTATTATNSTDSTTTPSTELTGSGDVDLGQTTAPTVTPPTTPAETAPTTSMPGLDGAA